MNTEFQDLPNVVSPKEVQTSVSYTHLDGSWFRRAYDAFGHVIGGEECEEGKIFIEPQGMCVMAGIGVNTGEAITALQSVKDKLDTCLLYTSRCV